MTRHRSRTLPMLALATAALALVGCSPDPEEVAARAAAVAVLETDELGEVLVDGEGDVLYVFEPDDAETVSCTFTCATNWPPFTAVEGSVPAAEDGVDGELLGTIADPSGGEVVTYNGWPLYRYAADRSPGEHRGQDRYLNGGDWYVMSPDGDPLIP